MEDFRSQTIYHDDDGSSGSGWRRTLIDVIETLVLSIFLFAAINMVSARIRVESVSMQPTLYAGDFVFVNKLAYKLGSPDRGEIIVFRYPPDPTQVPYIKRIVGLPGDHISISGGKVYINGEQLQELYIHVPTNHTGEWIVPQESLFVMGDNRGNSSDSRNWGMVPFENVIGKAEVIYWPPDDWRMLTFPSAAAAGPQ